MTPVPRVALINSCLNPIKPRDGATKVRRERPSSSMFDSISLSSPLRCDNASMTAPTSASPNSSMISSKGSVFFPNSSTPYTTRGGDTLNSNPSRRMFSINTPKCNSPRPCTSNPLSVASMRSATSVSASSRSLFSICRSVSCLPSFPASPESFTPNVMRNVGGSTGVDANGSVTLASQRVSVTVASTPPAMVTMSPETHRSTSSRFKLFDVNIFCTRNVSRTLPSLRRRTMILSPIRHEPSTTRPVTTRPRNGSRSIMLTSMLNGFASSPLGGGTCSTMRRKIASTLPEPSSTSRRVFSSNVSAAPARADAYATGKSNCSSVAPKEAIKSNKSLSTASHSALVTPSLSTLFNTTIGFNPFCTALRKTNLVCAIAPSIGSTSNKTPSTISNARSTSPPKSACPGVSTALIVTPSCAKLVYFA